MRRPGFFEGVGGLVVFVGMAEITSKCRIVTLDLIVEDVLCIPEFLASHRVGLGHGRF
jgi:hypothetical protein